MRHIRSILYALVLAPAVWVLTGVGFNHDLTTRGRGTFAVESFAGLLLLLLAGAAYGILVFAPISPSGPFLAGLIYLGVAVWALNAPDSYAGAFPSSVTKDGFDLSRPGYGLAAMLAVPLICTALSARRWAKYEPPVLPIIGVIGRARGAAAVAGTPVAVLETQVIGAPGPGFEPAGSAAGSEPTTVLRVPTRANEDEPSTAIVVPADETADVVATPAGSRPAEEVTVATPVVDDDSTQAIRLPTDIDGDRTQPLRLPTAASEPVGSPVASAAGSEPTGDATQVIRQPGPPAEDRTEVIRTGLVEPPGDRTQVVTLPVDALAPSIAALEQPHLADDPTSRLVPPRTDGGTRTAENRSAVLHLERPPDEVADDTTRLDIPAQRRPAADED